MITCVMALAFAMAINGVNAQIVLRGVVTDKQADSPLPGAYVALESTTATTISDGSGNYRLTGVKPGKAILRVSFMGYKTEKIALTIRQDTVINIVLEPAPILGEEVNIQATRAQSKYPTTWSTISNKEITSVNLGKDLPYIIQSTPSVVVTSDAGNGVGYTGINIRGTDLTRINVTINGIPLNDPESQGVWFVDLPDVASSTENIQIQRGVGTSTNGSGAFGASVNLLTSTLNQDPYGELNVSGGSFNTVKTTVRFGTGLMTNHFCVDGRLSYLHSDGYIDRAFSNLKSYYLSGGYYGKNTTLKLITFAGQERTYQAWNGVPKDSLSTHRTYNSCGEYTDPSGKPAYYSNQTDNYQQDHYQLIFSQRLTKQWNVNAALHYTKGRGYYENYAENQSFSAYGLNDVIAGSDTISQTNLVNRQMLDNDFYGFTFSSNYTLPDKLKVTLGGAWNQYYGRHFGKVIWAQYASNGDNDRNWYYNTGLKTDFNLYGKVNWQVLKKLSLFGDLQYRCIRYKMEGTLDDARTLDQLHVFNFFNPKGGLYLTLDKHNDLYFLFGIANREPSRDNYKDADLNRMPAAETLYDYELGYTFSHAVFSASANLYFMNYKDQLVLTGEINNVGEAVMVNVPHSYRAGIELSAGVDFFRKKLRWNVNATFSRNKIKDFTQYVDVYYPIQKSEGQKAIYLGETDLSFSPGVILGSVVSYKPLPQLSFSLNSKYVGRQYIDNTGNAGRSLQPYLVHGITAGYTVRPGIFREICFNLTVNNIFRRKYETNAWVYPYYVGEQYNESNGFFPQALVNFLFGISLKI